MGNYVAWILVGLVAGTICGMLTQRNNRDHDITLDMFFGVAGAMVGGLVLAPLFGLGQWGNASYNLTATIVAGVVSAGVLLAISYARRRAAR